MAVRIQQVLPHQEWHIYSKLYIHMTLWLQYKQWKPSAQCHIFTSRTSFFASIRLKRFPRFFNMVKNDFTSTRQLSNINT